MKAKKVLGVLLVTAITVVSLLGCGKGAGGETSAAASSISSDADSTKGADKGEKTNLLLWMPPFGTGDSLDKEFWTKTLEPWAEENNVKLSIEITPWGNYEEKYLTGFSSG